jgi:hypothetical protein
VLHSELHVSDESFNATAAMPEIRMAVRVPPPDSTEQLMVCPARTHAPID